MIEPWSWTLRYIGLAALFLVIYGLVLRPVKRQALAAFRELPGKLAGQAAVASPEGSPDTPGAETLLGSGKRAAQLKKQLTDKISVEPASAGRLVQSWLREEKS